jgi:hypothetical protein
MKLWKDRPEFVFLIGEVERRDYKWIKPEMNTFPVTVIPNPVGGVRGRDCMRKC